jgi:hypothetical protein
VLWGSPQNADRMSVISHQAYGPLVGVPRLLGLLERHRVRSTFFVPGYTAHRYPAWCVTSSRPGTRSPTTATCTNSRPGVSAQEEADHLDRGLAALEEVPASARSATARRCGTCRGAARRSSPSGGSCTTRA